MPPKQITYRKAYGLEFNSNSFEAREGSLEKALDIVISQDDIYKKARGNRVFVDPFPVVQKSLTEYGAKLIGIASDRVQVFNQDNNGNYTSTSTLSNGTGVTVSVGSTVKKSRPAESNGNLYFTTDTSVLKLESTTGSVLKTGIAQALDLEVYREVIQSIETYFPAGSQIGYRVLFGRKDANHNTVLGAPSELAIVINGLTDGAVTAGSSTSVLSVAHGLSDGDAIFVQDANGTGVSNGLYFVKKTDADNFKIKVDFLLTTDVVSSGTTTLKYGRYKYNKIQFSVPLDVASTEFIYQIYRTSASDDSSIPPDESTLQLVDEINVSTADITAGFITYYDTTPDLLLGAYLYTNPNTGEPRGEAEANNPPPMAKDLTLFKNHLFYASCTSPYRLALSVISSNSASMPDGSTVAIKIGATTRTYKAYADPKVGNKSVQATMTSFAGTTISVTYAGHGFANGDHVSVIEAVDSSESDTGEIPRGTYTVSNAMTDTFDLDVGGSYSNPASFTFAGVSDASGNRIFYAGQSSTNTVSSAIASTAKALVRAINRDPSHINIAFYVSGSEDVPGKMVFQSTGTSASFYLNVGSSAISDSFLPSIPTSGQTVIGTRDDELGMLYVAKEGQPESVPLYRRIAVGTRSNPILRVKPLRDSLIILKPEGAYRLNGTDFDSFSVTLLDSTVGIQASDSVAVLNNNVFCLSQQGVVAISETAAAIVSRSIEPLLSAILGRKDTNGNPVAETYSHAYSYESERFYVLATSSPTTATLDTVYVYNQLTNAWTQYSRTFTDAFVKPTEDRYYYIDTTGKIRQERKDQNRLDYSGDEFSTTVLTTPSPTTATLSVVGSSPNVGDVLVISSIIHRITSVDGSLVTFSAPYSFAALDTGLLYKKISSQLRTSPIVAGDPSKWKHFSEFQCQFRNSASASSITTSFQNDSAAGSEESTWVSEVAGLGWGNGPWGNFGWGEDEGIDLKFDTGIEGIARTYIPFECQRGTFIQANITHEVAAENLMLQMMSFTVRTYSQRVSR